MRMGKARREGAGEGRGGEQSDAAEENPAIADHFACRGERQQRDDHRQLKSVDDPDGLVGRSGSARAIVGSATLAIVPSRTDKVMASQIAPADQ